MAFIRSLSMYEDHACSRKETNIIFPTPQDLCWSFQMSFNWKIRTWYLRNIILVLAGILTALVTGLYFGYSVSVNGGLHRLNDSKYVKAMQS
jgi:hypothetical protein